MSEDGIELLLAERVGRVVAEAADAALARLRREGQGPLDQAVRAALRELARQGGELPDAGRDRVWLWILTARVVERAAGRRVAIDAGAPPRGDDAREPAVTAVTAVTVGDAGSELAPALQELALCASLVDRRAPAAVGRLLGVSPERAVALLAALVPAAPDARTAAREGLARRRAVGACPRADILAGFALRRATEEADDPADAVDAANTVNVVNAADAANAANTVNAADTESVARHLVGCPSCRGAVAGALEPVPPPSRTVLLAAMRARLRALEGRLADDDRGGSHGQRRRPRPSPAWPVVASLALLLATFYGPLRGWWTAPSAPVAAPIGLRLVSARGVTIAAAQGAPLEEGYLLPGSVVVCAPGAGEGVLQLAGGGRILLAPGACVQVHADGDRTLLELRGGTAWFDGQQADHPLRVLVGGVVAVVRQAAFVVRPIAGGIALEATAGTVELETEAGEASLEPGAPVTLRS